MKSQENYPTWKGYLLRLQQEAPKPKPVYCHLEIAGRPYFYGGEYHGLITREDGERLCSEEGNFLIRGSQTERGRFTLVLRVLGAVKNFKLYFEDGKHFVGEKRFDSVYSLAEDGLITMYVEHHAQNYIPNMAREPVYNSLSRYSSIGNRRAAGGRPSNQQRKESYSPEKEHPDPRDDAVVPESCPKNYDIYEKDSSVSPVHFHNPLFERKQRQQAPDFDYSLGYVPPDVCAPEYLAAEYGHMEIMDSYSCYHDDEGRRADGGNKKNLTPTSSDERKRTKKRVATEGHVLGNADQGHDQLYLELNPTPDSPTKSNGAKSRHQSYEQQGCGGCEQPARRSSASTQRPAPAPRQSSVAHVRQLSNGALVTLQDCSHGDSVAGDGLPSSPGLTGALSSIEELSPYKNTHHKLPSTGEATSLEQIMAVHRRIEENPHDFDCEAAMTSSSVSHVRQSSEPVEWLYHHHSRGSSMDGSDLRTNAAIRDGHGPRDPYAKLKQTAQKPSHVDRSGSFGSCESEISNVSSVSSAHTGSCHDAAVGYTHDSINRFSSEEERKTPPPHHTYGLLRRASESPLRACSSYNAGDSQRRHPQQHHQQHCASRDESPWQPRRERKVESKQQSRSRSSSAGRKRAPLSLFNTQCDEGLTGEETVASPRMEKRREPGREIGKNIETFNLFNAKETEIGPVSPSMRHKSESAMRSEYEHHPKLDEATARTSRTPPTGRRSVTAYNSAISSEVAKPKALQRRATTGELSKQKNGALPSRSKSNAAEKQEKSSIDAQSPAKTNKAPGTPSQRPRNGATSSSNRNRNVTSPSKTSRTRCAVAQQYDKEHQYKSHTYRGLQWCEYCGNFMWGIIMQGVQCIDCGLNVHKQCAKLVPNDCQPALKHVKHVFGVDLTTLVKLHGTQRPVVVDLCIADIERRGMTSEGIYRIPGSRDDVTELKAAFDRYGAEAEISTGEDVNAVACALKLYLRELPVPLIPYQLYSRFINAAKISHGDGKLDAIRMAMSAMPGAHFETVKYLIQHLGRVTECSPENQMTAHNLGIVFGPTVLRAPEKDAHAQYNLNDTHCQQEVVETMIEWRHHLFGAC